MDDKSALFLGFALMIIMLGMGLSLTLDDFRRIFKHPLAVITGLFIQIVLLPLLAFGIAFTFALPDFVAAGLILLAACPGGPTSNLITHLAKGDTALSVSLTAVSSFITILTIPFVINLGLENFYQAHQEIHLDVADTIKKTFLICILPIVLGMVIRRVKPDFAKKSDKPVRIASSLLLVAIILGIVLKEKENIVTYFAQAGLASLALNVGSMSLGFFGSKLLRLNTAQAISISIETGIQNGTMAIAIAIGILGQSELSITPGVYSLIMFMTGGAVIFYFKNKASGVGSELVE